MHTGSRVYMVDKFMAFYPDAFYALELVDDDDINSIRQNFV